MTLPNPIITEADVHAVRAVIAGSATSDQQKRCMRWIAEEASQVFNTPYVPDGADRESWIMIGRHQVGTLIRAMTTERVLKDAQKAAPQPSPKPSRGKTT